MLEQNDLIAIRKIMKEEIAESEKRTDARFAESENLILEELERTRSIMEKEIAAVQKILTNSVNITRLRNWKTTTLHCC